MTLAIKVGTQEVKYYHYLKETEINSIINGVSKDREMNGWDEIPIMIRVNEVKDYPYPGWCASIY